MFNLFSFKPIKNKSNFTAIEIKFLLKKLISGGNHIRALLYGKGILF